MKTTNPYAQRFASFYRKIKQEHRFDPPSPLEPVDQLVRGFLQWNSTCRAAQAAHQKLMAAMVDYNDLRISLPEEVVALIGANYPQAYERAARMHDCLQQIYLREHAMSLASLSNRSKKDVRVYLETLAGITPYVASQAIALCFGAHALPVDDKLAELLKQQEAVSPKATSEQVAAFLERQLRAGQAVEAHCLLQIWADASRRPTSIESATERQDKASTPSRRSRSNHKATATKGKRTVSKSTRGSAKKSVEGTKKQSSRR